MKRAIVFLVLALVTASPGHAQFTGHTVACDRRYPTDTQVPSKYGTQVIAAKGSYFLAGPSGIKVTGTQITITLSSLYNKYMYKNTTYNGYRLTATDGTTPAITAVTVDAQTHLVGFDASRITFSATYVQVNLAGLTFGVKDVVVLDVGFGNAAATPSSLTLLAGREKGTGVSVSRREGETLVTHGSNSHLNRFQSSSNPAHQRCSDLIPT